MKYRKKPIVIEAELVTLDNLEKIAGWIDGFKGDAYLEPDSPGIYIVTREGTMKADVGDYVIQGIAGEFYPCKPDIFEATYEEVE